MSFPGPVRIPYARTSCGHQRNPASAPPACSPHTLRTWAEAMRETWQAENRPGQVRCHPRQGPCKAGMPHPHEARPSCPADLLMEAAQEQVLETGQDSLGGQKEA